MRRILRKLRYEPVTGGARISDAFERKSWFRQFHGFPAALKRQ